MDTGRFHRVGSESAIRFRTRRVINRIRIPDPGPHEPEEHTMATVLGAPNTAQFTLDVRTAEGQTDAGMNGSVQFVRTDGTVLRNAPHVTFSVPRTFSLPAWPTV